MKRVAFLALATLSLDCDRKCDESTTPPAVVAASPSATAAAKHLLEARNTCVVLGPDPNHGFPGGVSMLAVIPTTYTGPPGEGYSVRHLWKLSCVPATGKCDGIQVRLSNADENGRLYFMDLNGIGAARIVSLAGRVAVVQFGPYRTFTIDAGRKRISYTESGGSDPTEGRGEVECEDTHANGPQREDGLPESPSTAL